MEDAYAAKFRQFGKSNVIFRAGVDHLQRRLQPLGAEVRVSVQRAGEFAEVRVKDEGAGISAKAQARLFQPFYTTRTIGGTGLGLWLSREMVERVGGTLTFESEPALRPGTEFIIRLPVTEA